MLQFVAATTARLVGTVVAGTASVGTVSAVVVGEVDETRRTITVLVVSLIVIAVILTALTVWYWFYTSPRRRADELMVDLDQLARTERSATTIVMDEPLIETEVPDPLPSPSAHPATLPARIVSSGRATPTVTPEPQADPLPTPAAAAVAGSVEAASTVAVPVEDQPTRTHRPARLTPDRPTPDRPTPDRTAAIVDTVARSGGGQAGQSSPPRPAPVTMQGRLGPAAPQPAPVVRDEVAVARARRRGDQTADTGEGLSDDDWAAVMRSAFAKLDR